jgi:hypothetical protein
MQTFRVDVRHPVEFLGAVIDAFGEAARISFEGDLDVLRQVRLPGASEGETAALRRGTTTPSQDFRVIPLSREVVPSLLAVLPRVGLRSNVLHVQVEQAGQLVFGAYDHFGPSTVWVSQSFGMSRLDALLQQGVIRSVSLTPHAG